MLNLGATTAKPGAAPSAHIKDGTDAGFMADVIEASRVQPVIVDFWATWCGPCKTLTPALEKAVEAAGGKVKLVKIDVDKNPAYAGQLKVQSIPTVYAFIDGQPVDGFMGAVPDSQLKAFIDKLIAASGDGEAVAGPIDDLMTFAAEALAGGDLANAAAAYAQVLQADPENVKAIAGLGRAHLLGGQADRAREIADMAPAGAKDADLDSLRAALKLAEEAPSDTAAFEAALAADPNDHQARLDLAKAYAGTGRLEQAADELLKIIEADRAWNDEAARKQLLLVFEAAGPMSEVAKTGRRRLSAILFS
jgi:putative thioredoxin